MLAILTVGMATTDLAAAPGNDSIRTGSAVNVDVSGRFGSPRVEPNQSEGRRVAGAAATFNSITRIKSPLLINMSPISSTI